MIRTEPTDCIWKLFDLILRKDQIGEIRERTDLVWDAFDLILRKIQLCQLFQPPNLLQTKSMFPSNTHLKTSEA